MLGKLKAAKHFAVSPACRDTGPPFEAGFVFSELFS